MTTTTAKKLTTKTLAFTIERPALLRALSSAQAVAQTRNTMPILACVLLTADAGRLGIVATDLEIGVSMSAPCDVGTVGQCVVPVRKLHDIVKNLAGSAVDIAVEDGTLSVKAGRSRFTLRTLEARDFPGLPQPKAADAMVTLDASVLADMLDKTLMAVSNDVNRLVLMGVHVSHADGRLTVAATDSHRLARVSRAIEAKGIPAAGVILPQRALHEARRLLERAEGAVTLTLGTATAFLVIGDATLSMRMIEGQFPNFDAVIPKESTITAGVQASALLGALRRMQVMATDKVRGVKLVLDDGTLTASISNADFGGEGREELETDYRGQPFAIGFNGQYLIDALGIESATDRVELGFTDELSPGLLRFGDDADCIYVAMPCRL